MVSCRSKKSAAPATIATSDNLRLIAQYPIAVKEPSDLCLSPDRQSLWTVSDEDGEVYQMDLKGAILRQFKSEMPDLEGITTVGDSQLAILSERNRELEIVDYFGNVKSRSKVDMVGERNSGPESVTFDEAAAVFYTLKEQSPGLLLTLDRDLHEISRTSLNFAQDYSAMSFEATRGHLWVMSDQSKSMFVLDSDMKIQTAFSANIPQAEGMSVDYLARRLYVVCDKTAMLYIFSFSDY